MAIPEVLALLEKHNFKSLVLMGIEVRQRKYPAPNNLTCRPAVACLRAAVYARLARTWLRRARPRGRRVELQ